MLAVIKNTAIANRKCLTIPFIVPHSRSTFDLLLADLAPLFYLILALEASIGIDQFIIIFSHSI